MTDLPTIWADVNLRMDTFLHTSLIKDHGASYLAVTGLRVLVIGTIALAFSRVLGAVQTLPRRRRGQSLAAYFRTPWWRAPATMVLGGLVIMAVMFLLQAFAGNLQPQTNRLGNFTPYLIATYGGLILVAFGIAIFAHCFRVNLKRPPCPPSAV